MLTWLNGCTCGPQTSENYLHLYAIHTWKDTLLPACNFAAKDIQKVDIYLRSSIRMDSESQALSITGDSRSLLVGFADGTVASLSWLGKVRAIPSGTRALVPMHQFSSLCRKAGA